MATIRTTYKFKCDLDKGTLETTLRNSLMQADALADAFAVTVQRNGADVDISGMTVYGYLYANATKTTVPLKGTVSGSTATVILSEDCYAVPGYASLMIQLHDGDVRHTVLKVDFVVTRTGGTLVLDGDNILPTLAELLGQISAMEQATAEAREATAVANQAVENVEAFKGEIQGDITALSEGIGDLKSASIQFPYYKSLDPTIQNDRVRDNRTFEDSSLSGFSNTVIDVTPGEMYKISGWTNADYYAPAYWSDSALVAVIASEVAAGAYTDYVTVVPNGATKMMINGRTTAPIAVKKNLQTEQSIEFIEDVNSKLPNHYREYVEYPVTVTNDKLANATTFALDTFSGFQTVKIPVAAGEKYKVTAYQVSDTYPAVIFWSGSAAVGIVNNSVTNEEITIPENTTEMAINGRASQGYTITVEKYGYGSADDFWASYEDVLANSGGTVLQKTKHLGVNVSANNVIHVYMSGYADDVDLECRIEPKSGNSLPDIGGWYKCANTSGVVLDAPGSTAQAIVAHDTDFLSPSIVYAASNVDGDYPNMTQNLLTGGWHVYGGGTTDGTPTARNISLKVFCNGVEITSGNSARGNEVVVEIVNRIQASNTEKEDGTGREVAELTYRIVFGDGFRANVFGTIKALEEIYYAQFYGISAYLMSVPFYWVGCRATKQPVTPSSNVVRCGDKYCTEISQSGASDAFVLGFDPTYDLGTQYANSWLHSFISGTHKGYAVLISQDAACTQESMLHMVANDTVFWRGYYDLHQIY